jgi:PAS domain S-box-containing protein
MPSRFTNNLARVASLGEGRRSDLRGGLAGMLLLIGLVVADAVLGQDVALAGTFILAPFVAAIWAGVAVTAVVGGLAIAAAVTSGLWNTEFGGADYDSGLALVALGAAFAIASAWSRERVRRGTARVQLLNEVGAIADGSLPLAQTLDRILEVSVPAIADFCMIDVLHDHRVVRSAVRAVGRTDARQIERELREREPTPPEWMTRPEAPFPRQPRFIPEFDEESLGRLAHDPADLEWLRSLGLTSSITVPLIARGRMLGALTVNTAWSERRYDLEDVRFVQTLAGRVGLALDNAGLFSDLESVERRMDNVMSLLDEAVVIHDSQGVLVYANPSAGRMMGIAATGSSSAAEIGDRFDIRDEDGNPLTAEALVGRSALAGEVVEPLMLRVTDRESGEERWLISRAKPILGPEDRALYSVTAIEDVTEVKRGESAQRLLAQIGGFLSSSTDYRGMLRGLASLTVPAFADWCTVDMLAPGGKVEQLAADHADPGKRADLLRLRERFPVRLWDDGGETEALEDARAQLIETPDELIERLAVDSEHEALLRSIGMRSGLMAPMSVGGRSLGVLSFGTSSRKFGQADLDLAAEIARRAATAVENARLAEERSEVARVLQEGLMPRALPHMRGWETAAVYQPAGEVNAVGGDFYDAFEIEGGWMVTIGDVVGRGAAAASLTALARHTIRTAGSLTGDPCKALKLLDEALRARGETSICTVAILILPESDADTVEVRMVSAGHPLPLLLRDGEVAELGRPGPLLGAFAGSSWEPVSHEIAAGDQLVVFTDGVIEAQGAADRFGEDRLRKHLAGAESPLGAIGRVTSALEAFVGRDPDDDVALVAVRRSGALRPAPDEAGDLAHDSTVV